MSPDHREPPECPTCKVPTKPIMVAVYFIPGDGQNHAIPRGKPAFYQCSICNQGFDAEFYCPKHRMPMVEQEPVTVQNVVAPPIVGDRKTHIVYTCPVPGCVEAQSR